MAQNGNKIWACVTDLRTRWTNPRTEPQSSQRRKFFEFARNWTRELIITWWNRLARKCEPAWHSYEQDSPIHVPRYIQVNDVSSLSSLGMEPVSWLSPDGTEWQGKVSGSMRDRPTNKINRATYRATVKSTTSVLRIGSELNLWVDFQLIEQNSKEMSAKAWHS
jgi:hypothetical protein